MVARLAYAKEKDADARSITYNEEEEANVGYIGPPCLIFAAMHGKNISIPDLLQNSQFSIDNCVSGPHKKIDDITFMGTDAAKMERNELFLIYFRRLSIIE